MFFSLLDPAASLHVGATDFISASGNFFFTVNDFIEIFCDILQGYLFQKTKNKWLINGGWGVRVGN